MQIETKSGTLGRVVDCSNDAALLGIRERREVQNRERQKQETRRPHHRT
jgi:hypothetical protein